MWWFCSSVIWGYWILMVWRNVLPSFSGLVHPTLIDPHPVTQWSCIIPQQNKILRYTAENSSKITWKNLHYLYSDLIFMLCRSRRNVCISKVCHVSSCIMSAEPRGSWKHAISWLSSSSYVGKMCSWILSSRGSALYKGYLPNRWGR